MDYSARAVGFLVLLFCTDLSTAQISTNGGNLKSDHPSISFISRDQILNSGGTAYFSCHVLNLGHDRVTWLKSRLSESLESGQGQPATMAIAVGDDVVVPDDDGHINVKNIRNVYTLQIRNVQARDAGTYYCQLSHNVMATTELVVRSPPVFPEIGTASAPVIFGEGESGNLSCFAQGYPMPTIFWGRKENLSPFDNLGNGTIYRISFAKDTTRGRYYCLAINSLGAIRKAIDVEVDVVAQVFITRPRVGVSSGQDAILECLSIGNPAPEVIWLKGDQFLTNDDHYRLNSRRSSRSDDSNFTNSTLIVRSVSEEELGTYTCRGENRLGYSTGKISLSDNSDDDGATKISLSEAAGGKGKLSSEIQGVASEPASLNIPTVSATATPVKSGAKIPTKTRYRGVISHRI